MIQPGQTYRSLSKGHHPADEPVRIRIISAPTGAADLDGMRKIWVATLNSTGREIRPRWMRAERLHATPTTKGGQPRRTGYVLETP
ncbi:hypothetical protein OG244_28485 [Streptomyces brevispora]|uniref:hypothetical protein n=1 Tax=Streptomyces brevispora TaxID=887462 RepID=UPI002E373183|nr:hypothetical protein [Streptomyces brevispora]